MGGFGKAAQDAERSATRALRGATGARKAAAQESLDAAWVGAEAAEVEPLSCKRRGICPSCTVRRMADTAAHLVENV